MAASRSSVQGGSRVEPPLEGRRVLVTGASRPAGIGQAVVERCAEAGARVAAIGLSTYDSELGYQDAGARSAGAHAVQLAEQGLVVCGLPERDLADLGVPEQVVEDAAATLEGPLNGLVINHAHSVKAPLGAWTAEHIDRHLVVNVRATMLLVQAFARQVPADMTASVVVMTSGQYLGPMVDEVAYAVSKDAVRGLCRQAAAALSGQSIRVNCVNPGPTDTGYAIGAAAEQVAAQFPQGRWGLPEDAARLIVFLLSDDARWITGQTIASEGGFQR